MKLLTILIVMFGLTLSNIIAQDNQSYLIQYKDGQKALINLPNASKVVDDKNNIEINSYDYKLLIPKHNITRKGFVTQQYVSDSITTKAIRVNCEGGKVSIINPLNRGYAAIFDSQFHQIEYFSPETEKLEFIIGEYNPKLYWLSIGKPLIGINTLQR